MPTEVKEKKQRARKSTGDGTGLVSPFYRLLLRTYNISSDKSDIFFHFRPLKLLWMMGAKILSLKLEPV